MQPCLTNQGPFWDYAFKFDVKNPGWVFIILAIIMILIGGIRSSGGISGICLGLSSSFFCWLIIVYFCYNCDCNISWGLVGISVICTILAILSASSALFSTTVSTSTQSNVNTQAQQSQTQQN